jgi:hypothetical protein
MFLRFFFRFFSSAIALSGGGVFVAVCLVFARGPALLQQRDFITAAEICLYSVLPVSALFAIVDAIREKKKKPIDGANAEENPYFHER